MTEQKNEQGASKGSDHAKNTATSINYVKDAKKQIIETGNPSTDRNDEPPPYTPSEDTQKYLQSKRRNWERIAAFIGAIGLVVFLSQALIYYLTLREVSRSANVAQDAVNQTRDQFRQDQRPYIWLTNNLGQPEFVLTRPDTTVGQVVWDWQFTNYGKTPAYDVRFRQYFKLGSEFHPSFGSTEQPAIGSPLPPTKVNFSTNVSEQITADEFRRLIDTDQAIAIRMVMEYTDGYGGKYESGFCLERLRTKAISYCRDGNYIK